MYRGKATIVDTWMLFVRNFLVLVRPFLLYLHELGPVTTLAVLLIT